MPCQPRSVSAELGIPSPEGQRVFRLLGAPVATLGASPQGPQLEPAEIGIGAEVRHLHFSCGRSESPAQDIGDEGVP